jgi:hypothetical protein
VPTEGKPTDPTVKKKCTIANSEFEVKEKLTGRSPKGGEGLRWTAVPSKKKKKKRRKKKKEKKTFVN